PRIFAAGDKRREIGQGQADGNSKGNADPAHAINVLTLTSPFTTGSRYRSESENASEADFAPEAADRFASSAWLQKRNRPKERFPILWDKCNSGKVQCCLCRSCADGDREGLAGDRDGAGAAYLAIEAISTLRVGVGVEACPADGE